MEYSICASKVSSRAARWRSNRGYVTHHPHHPSQTEIGTSLPQPHPKVYVYTSISLNDLMAIYLSYISFISSTDAGIGGYFQPRR